MMNLLMNDTFVWSVIGIAVAILAWMVWPKKNVTETLEEVKAAEAAPAKVESQITDAVTTKAPAKKAPVKKAAAPKKTATTTKKKTAPKKAVKKGKK